MPCEPAVDAGTSRARCQLHDIVPGVMCWGGTRTSDVRMTPAEDESVADDKRPSRGSGDPADAQVASSLGADPDAELTPDGRDLAREDLDPGAPIEVAPDEVDAEELLEAVDEVDDTPGEADPETVVLRQQRGLRRARQVDTVEAAFFGACDGDLPLGVLVDAVAGLLEVDGAALASDILRQVRPLLADGLLTVHRA